MSAIYSPGGGFAGYAAPIAGALPWNSGGAAAMQPDGYAAAYNASLAQNRSNYENIMAGYRQTIAAQNAASEAISAGYTKLYDETLAGIRGIGSARDTAIMRSAGQALGAGTQRLIDRGLGNTTVVNSMERGVNADRDQALSENAANVAGLTAQYGSQLGLARQRALEEQQQRATGLALGQLGFMNSVSASYPDASRYAMLAQQRGMARGGGGGGGYSGLGGGFAGRLGYVPSERPSFQTGFYSSPNTGGGGGLFAGSSYTGGSSGYSGYSDGADPFAGFGASIGQGVGQAVGDYGSIFGAGSAIAGGFMDAGGGGGYSGGGDYGSDSDWAYSGGGDY